MNLFQSIVALCSWSLHVSAFLTPHHVSSWKAAPRDTSISLSKELTQDPHISSIDTNRRSFVSKACAAFGAATVGSIFTAPTHANALPGVTVAEFETILKSSAKSIQSVELSGPKSETAVVTLIDGTQFSITDLYESPTDPRSPLKLIASCRSYNVPTKSVGLEEAVLSLSSSGSKKKRVYMNERVRIAAEKERERKIRLEEDERERLAELEKMGM